jgi:hypothetical protein
MLHTRGEDFTQRGETDTCTHSYRGIPEGANYGMQSAAKHQILRCVGGGGSAWEHAHSLPGDLHS